MAEHADPAELTESPTAAGRAHWTRKVSTASIVWIAGMIALASLGGWLGVRFLHDRHVNSQRTEFVEAARQGALNLATIDFSTADTDVQRILDSSTGSFHDDFEKRSKPFIEVIKKAQSKSQGTIMAAGVESEESDKAKVLVTMSVKMSDSATANPTPAVWRMRIQVERAGDGAKVSEVQFVQ